jgi:non-specific serine/threonine protein kinase
LGDKYGTAFSLSGLAASASALGESERAAILLGATRALLDSLGAFLEPLFYGEFQQCLANTRDTLGEPAFDTAFARGRQVPLDEALRIALREDAPATPNTHHPVPVTHHA